jgi:hypothetical protein
MDTQLIERRAIISEILDRHLTADALEFALEVYDDSFATAVTFSPGEFCQCLNTLMLETTLTEATCLALLSDLRGLPNSSDRTMPEPESASSRADDSQPTEEDAAHTVIRAPVCVRWVQDDIFGTQFVDPANLPPAFFDYLQS